MPSWHPWATSDIQDDIQDGFQNMFFCYYGHFYVKIICKIIIYTVIGAHICLLDVFIALMSNYEFKMASKMADLRKNGRKTHILRLHIIIALSRKCDSSYLRKNG